MNLAITIILSVIAIMLMIIAFLPQKVAKRKMESFVKDNENYVDWDVPDWGYVGCDVEMGAEEEK